MWRTERWAPAGFASLFVRGAVTAMLLYEYQVRDQFDNVRSVAGRMKEKFLAGATPEDILADRDIVETAYKQLDKLLPPEVDRGDFERHLNWIQYWMGQNKPESCRRDVESLCDFDLPHLERGFRDWAASHTHYDAEFAAQVGPLLRDRHLDSAVRKAFVILKERMVTIFGLPHNLDGTDLVNAVFGRKGKVAEQVPPEEQQAVRNLLDGLYGVFRNLYGHRNVEPEWYETETILSGVNWTLKYLEKFK